MSEATEITIKGLSDLAVGTYLLVDVRDAISFGYGAIPGAVSMPSRLKPESWQRIRNIYYIA